MIKAIRKKRVVVTGLAVIAPNGIGVERFWQANVKGISGVNRDLSFKTTSFRTKIAGQVRGFNPSRYIDNFIPQRIDRASEFALACAKMALNDSGLRLSSVNLDRFGVALGSGLGGMIFYEKQILDMQKYGHRKTHPAAVPRVMPNAPTAHISSAFKLSGPTLTLSTACASGTHAIGTALDLIRNGRADFMLAGGTEAPLTFYTFAAFDALRVMSTNNTQPQRACRPFDAARDGFVLGEGAAILMLEELSHATKRNARIYAEVAGYGAGSDAQHMVIPPENGQGAARTMRNALQDASLKPEDVDYINAHGTGTKINDLAETNAIKLVFGPKTRVPISSTKSMIGHALGAAGAIESVVCCLAIQNNIAPPTTNLDTQDPFCDLDYVPLIARPRKIKTALSNSFAFGGHNATIIFCKL
jgi:3-oxoacyl-[acyl-carrier-protein] synthase II